MKRDLRNEGGNVILIRGGMLLLEINYSNMTIWCSKNIYDYYQCYC